MQKFVSRFNFSQLLPLPRPVRKSAFKRVNFERNLQYSSLVSVCRKMYFWCQLQHTTTFVRGFGGRHYVDFQCFGHDEALHFLLCIVCAMLHLCDCLRKRNRSSEMFFSFWEQFCWLLFGCMCTSNTSVFLWLSSAQSRSFDSANHCGGVLYVSLSFDVVPCAFSVCAKTPYFGRLQGKFIVKLCLRAYSLKENFSSGEEENC